MAGFRFDKLANRVFAAPMSGVSDPPFRRAAMRAGAGLVVSEMTASEDLVRGSVAMVRKTAAADDAVFGPARRSSNLFMPHVVQLAGREARWMEEGARVASGAGADLIDINMGCPARMVTKGLSGSALMRDPDHALRLIEATVRGATGPVSLKMRLGWDRSTMNAAEIAVRAVEAGVCMITVHGRTRQQFYQGEADWAAVRAVKRAVDVPVVVNGDIIDARGARRALALSQADAVMVGRAAIGRPWLYGAIARALETGGEVTPPTLRHRRDALGRQLAESVAFHGADVGVRMMRKHFAAAIEDAASMPAPPQAALVGAVRRTVCTAETPEAADRALADAFDRLGDAAAAPLKQAA